MAPAYSRPSPLALFALPRHGTQDLGGHRVLVHQAGCKNRKRAYSPPTQVLRALWAVAPCVDVFSAAWPPPQIPATLSREPIVSRPLSSALARPSTGDPAPAPFALYLSGVRRPRRAETHLTCLICVSTQARSICTTHLSSADASLHIGGVGQWCVGRRLQGAGRVGGEQREEVGGVGGAQREVYQRRLVVTAAGLAKRARTAGNSLYLQHNKFPY